MRCLCVDLGDVIITHWVALVMWLCVLVARIDSGSWAGRALPQSGELQGLFH